MALTLARGIHLINSRLRAGLGAWSYQQAVPLVRLRGADVRRRRPGADRHGRGTCGRRPWAWTWSSTIPTSRTATTRPWASAAWRRSTSCSAQSLVVSVHCPLTDETRHMIDAAAIAQMPRGSYLVNTARGGVVDTRAVPEAIASGQLAGAGIDVLETEPPPDDDPLMVAWRDPDHPAHHRLILNPHTAFYSEEGLMDIRLKTAEACRRALLGEPLRNVVN